MFDFFSRQFSSIFSRIAGQKKLTARDIDETTGTIRQTLIDADVPHELAQAFVKELQEELVEQKIVRSLKPAEHIARIMHQKIMNFLGSSGQQVAWPAKFPATVLVMGLQGAGKTTTVAKLAHMIQKKQRKKVAVMSSDFRRPAAIEQLEYLAKKAAIGFIKPNASSVVSAVLEAQERARAEKYDLLFIDTAGRLHVDNDLLEELRAVDTRIKPTDKLLVMDAMTGQESLAIARAFEQAVGFHGAIVTKLDSNARAGLVFSFYQALKKPVLFVGQGERIDDLETFDAERIAGRLLGMGDLQTLIEQAEEKVNKQEQERVMRSIAQGEFTLNDFAQQLEMVNKMGSLSHMMKYIPGGLSQGVTVDMVQKGEQEMKKFRAILSSMRLPERARPGRLSPHRKKAIAHGAGVGLTDIDMLMQRFEQARQYGKLLKKAGIFKGLF